MSSSQVGHCYGSLHRVFKFLGICEHLWVQQESLNGPALSSISWRARLLHRLDWDPAILCVANSLEAGHTGQRLLFKLCYASVGVYSATSLCKSKWQKVYV